MNCQTFRQQCMLDPTCEEESFLAHQQTCPTCAAFTADLMQFEQVLVEAVKVEVPVGLTERLLRQPTRPVLTVVSPWYQRPLYRLAAGFILLIFGILTVWLQVKSISPNNIIAYVENEPQAFLTEAEVPAEELQGMFQAIGAKLTGEIGQVSFCKVLKLNGYKSAHMVLAGTKGPINVLLIRNSRMAGSHILDRSELKAIILPASWGNIAVIGVPEEPLEPVVTRLNQAIKWL